MASSNPTAAEAGKKYEVRWFTQLYGLVLKKPSKPLLGPKSLDQLAKEGRKKIVAFGSDSDDDNKQESKPKLSATEARKKKQTEMEHERALAEDPTAFEYDEVYDDIVEKRNEKLESQKVADKERKPKYVAQLLKSAKLRELEKHARDERKQQKEREAEGDQFKDEEVFVTGAYRKQMEEVQKYKDEEDRKEIFERHMDVKRQQNLGGFYKHLLNDLSRTGASKVKTEPIDADLKETVPNNTATSSNTKSKDVESFAKQSEPSKEKSYRRRKRTTGSSSDEDNNLSKHKLPAKSKEKRSIYSSEDEESNHRDTTRRKKQQRSIYSSEEDRSPSPPRSDGALPRGGLQMMAKKARDRGARSTATRAEQQKRFFTPTPPGSPERHAAEKTDAKTNGNEESKRAERSPSSGGDTVTENTEKPASVQATNSADFGLKKITPEERLKKLSLAFKQRNDEQTIDGYRERYFVRKSKAQIVPPLVGSER